MDLTWLGALELLPTAQIAPLLQVLLMQTALQV
jgi:hypothetical protein